LRDDSIQHSEAPAGAAPGEGAALPGGGESSAPQAGEESDTLSALGSDVAALIADARTYAEAEVAFQKTRAALAAKTGARALVLLALALVLLHIALIALAVGAVFALSPLLGMWGAVAVVVGTLLVGVVALLLAARGDSDMLAAMFAQDRDAP
jgi:hypothetical protein